MSARRLVYAGAFPGVGRFRVTWSAEFEEYRVQLIDTADQLLAEYFTDDRADAVATADRMLADRAALVGIE
jgi:rRNA-processing protein FCF1